MVKYSWSPPSADVSNVICYPPWIEYAGHLQLHRCLHITLHTLHITRSLVLTGQMLSCRSCVSKWTEEVSLSLSFNFGGRPNRLWPMVSWWSLILSISLSAWTAARSDYLTHSSVIPAPDLLQSCVCCADIWVIKHVFVFVFPAQCQSYVLDFPVCL